MYEMTDFTEPDQPEVEPRSRSVSFPDHYLVPYIEMCKRSKRITCGCSIFLIGLAIFCFFATNYMINYPVTEARKIAFVWAGIFCLVAAASCLNLRFRILPLCGDGPDDNVQFVIVRRDVEFSDSFSGNFNMRQSFLHGTPIEGPSQTETPEDTPSRAHSIDDPCFARVSTFQSNGHAHPPRRSISDGVTPDNPQQPQSRPVDISGPSLKKKRIDFKQLNNSGTVSDKNEYPPNYSTFDNVCGANNTEPLLSQSTHQNGYDTHETEPLLAESTYDNGCDTLETEPLLEKKSS